MNKPKYPFMEKEIKYLDQGSDHAIIIPPSRADITHLGERMRDNIREWCDEHTPGWGIHVGDALSNVYMIFKSKEDALLFKVTWC